MVIASGPVRQGVGLICVKNADLLFRKERLGKMRKRARESGRAVFAFGSAPPAGAGGGPDQKF